MKQLFEHAQGLACKLIMMGIAHKGSTHAHGNDQSVLARTEIPYSTLKKNS